MRIGGIRVEILLDRLVHQIVRRSVGPHHFIVDDAGNDEIAAGVFRIGRFEVMALLGKGLPEQAGP